LNTIVDFDEHAARLMRAGFTILQPQTISPFLSAKVRDDFYEFLGLDDAVKQKCRTNDARGLLDAGYAIAESQNGMYESFTFRPRIQYSLKESFAGESPQEVLPLLSSMNQLFIESQQLVFQVVKNQSLRVHAPKLSMLLHNVFLYRDQLEIRRYFGEQEQPSPHIDSGVFSLRLFDTYPDMLIGNPEWPHRNYDLFRRMPHEFRIRTVSESLKLVTVPAEGGMFLFPGMEFQFASGHQIPAVWHNSVAHQNDPPGSKRISISYQLHLENGESGEVDDRKI